MRVRGTFIAGSSFSSGTPSCGRVSLGLRPVIKRFFLFFFFRCKVFLQGSNRLRVRQRQARHRGDAFTRNVPKSKVQQLISNAAGASVSDATHYFSNNKTEIFPATFPSNFQIHFIVKKDAVLFLVCFSLFFHLFFNLTIYSRNLTRCQ